MAVFDWDKIQPQQVTELYRRKIAVAESMTVAKLEAREGSTTQAHRHEHEEVIILLKGCWRFHFPTGDVTLWPNQILTIPSGTEHSSEVLEDVVAIDVCSPRRHDWVSGEDRVLHYDPDQQLWGV